MRATYNKSLKRDQIELYPHRTSYNCRQVSRWRGYLPHESTNITEEEEEEEEEETVR